MFQRIVPFILLISWLSADTKRSEANNGEPAQKPVIQQLADGTFQLGHIQFDQASREITFPAQVEQTKEIIEYILVTPKGKIHETLFVTDITPSHLNVVLKLLNYQESTELFPMLIDGQVSETLNTVEDSVRKAARLQILVTLGEGNNAKTYPVTELITHAHTKRDMAPTPFVNGGSRLKYGKFSADINGDIIALLTDPTAMLNYPGKDRLDDTLWVPNTKRLPPYGSKVTITLKPYNGPL